MPQSLTRVDRLVPLAEVLVPGYEGLGLSRDPETSPEDVHGLELGRDFTAGRKLKLSFLETVEGQSDLTVSLLEAEEGLGLQEKRLVICVAIDDGEPLFSLGLPEATAEQPHPKKARFGRPHHHDRGNVRKVPAS
jgi:hypothetical protein